MGLLDRLRGKKDKQEAKEEPASSQQERPQPSSGKRVKRYTSEGKPVYE